MTTIDEIVYGPEPPYERGTMDDLVFRRLEAGDLEWCMRLAAEAWPIKDHLTSEPDEWRLMAPYIDVASGWSNWHEIACLKSKEPIGLLFGEIRGKGSTGVGSKIISSELKIITKFILGRYGRVERLPRVLSNFLMTEMKLIIGRPDADAEINLFLVDSKHRGRGVGLTLMDRFVDEARSQGVCTMSVYADDHASNWGFYEKYGFKRRGTFYDNWSSYFNQVDSYGIRLALDLRANTDSVRKRY